MRVRMSSEGEGLSGSLNVHGNWWLPGQEDRPVGGVLKFSPDAGGELQLAGALDRAVGQSPVLGNTILGQTADSRRITLIDAYTTGGRATGEGVPIEQVWRCGTML